jgi:hypothetical protein
MEKTHHRRHALGVVEKLLSLITFFAAAKKVIPPPGRRLLNKKQDKKSEWPQEKSPITPAALRQKKNPTRPASPSGI